MARMISGVDMDAFGKFVERLTCCAIAPCGDPACPVCTVNVRCAVAVCPYECRLVKGHPGKCQPTTRKAKPVKV